MNRKEEVFMDERATKEKMRKLAEQQHDKLLTLDRTIKALKEERDSKDKEIDVINKKYEVLLDQYNEMEGRWTEERKQRNYLQQEVMRLERGTNQQSPQRGHITKPLPRVMDQRASSFNIMRGQTTGTGGGVSGSERSDSHYFKQEKEVTSGLQESDVGQPPSPGNDKEKHILIARVHHLLKENTRLQGELRDITLHGGGVSGGNPHYRQLQQGGPPPVAIKALSDEQEDLLQIFEDIKNDRFQAVQQVFVTSRVNKELVEVESLLLKNAFFVDWKDLTSPDISLECSLLYAQDLAVNSKNVDTYVQTLLQLVKQQIGHKVNLNGIISHQIIYHFAKEVVFLIAKMAVALPPLRFIKPRAMVEYFNPFVHSSVSNEVMVVTKVLDVGMGTEQNEVLRKALVGVEQMVL